VAIASCELFRFAFIFLFGLMVRCRFDF